MMVFWIVSALILAVSCAVLIHALGKSSSEDHNKQRGGFALDKNFYHSQLAEIDADLKRGLIDQNNAEEARLEIARHLLASDRQSAAVVKPQKRNAFYKVLLSCGVLMIPLVSLSAYYMMGQPDLPSAPFAAFMAKDPATLSPAQKIVRLEVQLSENPDDKVVVDQLASSYLLAGRMQDAVNTYMDALRLNGENAPRLVGYGIALSQYEGGVITEDAQKAFEKATQLAPDDYIPQLYLSAAYAQNKDYKKAVDQLQNFLARSPQNAPFRDQIENTIKAYRQQIDGSEDTSTIGTVDQEGILAMVNGLADKLAAHPDNLEGWQRLVHSWLVLGDKRKAQSVLEEGSAKLSHDKSRLLQKYAESLGLTGKEGGQ